VVAKLRKAGAIILGKATLGEFGAGDAYGSLFGATRNPYDLERTSGGSSGGSGACTSANLTAVAVGEEGFVQPSACAPLALRGEWGEPPPLASTSERVRSTFRAPNTPGKRSRSIKCHKSGQGLRSLIQHPMK
jgi:hypothetical protein